MKRAAPPVTSPDKRSRVEIARAAAAVAPNRDGAKSKSAVSAALRLGASATAAAQAAAARRASSAFTRTSTAATSSITRPATGVDLAARGVASQAAVTVRRLSPITRLPLTTATSSVSTPQPAVRRIVASGLTAASRTVSPAIQRINSAPLTRPLSAINGRAPIAAIRPTSLPFNATAGGRRMPLVLPTEKASEGTDMMDGRWCCAKCGRANKNLRKICGRQKCGGIAPLNLKHVVIDCANVACRYGTDHSMHPPAGKHHDVERHKLFHWQGVREACLHYKEMGLEISLVSKENWPAPMPADLMEFACTVPRVDGDHENDDYFVLKIAYQKNCFYVTNDNFRNWKEEVEDEQMAIWFLSTKKLLHVSYIFTGEGKFIPRRDAKLCWTDGDDSPRQTSHSKAPSQAVLVPVIAKHATPKSSQPFAPLPPSSLETSPVPLYEPEDDPEIDTETELLNLLIPDDLVDDNLDDVLIDTDGAELGNDDINELELDEDADDSPDELDLDDDEADLGNELISTTNTETQVPLTTLLESCLEDANNLRADSEQGDEELDLDSELDAVGAELDEVDAIVMEDDEIDLGGDFEDLGSNEIEFEPEIELGGEPEIELAEDEEEVEIVEVVVVEPPAKVIKQEPEKVRRYSDIYGF